MRAIPVTTGGHVWVPSGVRLTRCVEALRRIGYRLDLDDRGRVVAHRLH
jgi:hypothetical protein